MRLVWLDEQPSGTKPQEPQYFSFWKVAWHCQTGANLGQDFTMASFLWSYILYREQGHNYICNGQVAECKAHSVDIKWEGLVHYYGSYEFVLWEGPFQCLTQILTMPPALHVGKSVLEVQGLLTVNDLAALPRGFVWTDSQCWVRHCSKTH